MFREFQLPDGTMAESVQDVERYISESGSALASDYSDSFFKNKRCFDKKAQREKLRSDFIYNLKKEIWTND
ncbi:MAG: hypothetical protein IJS26_05515 [Alphaproteobacteria bacterium]|nr:hypothetical protein [Alphaproteobacteria bacterium]